MFTLRYTPPYDWPWILGFLRARAVAGVEEVGEHVYRRSLALEGHQGLVTVTPHANPQETALVVTLSDGLLPVAQQVLARIERLLDLALNPATMLASLGSLAANRPGLRLPGCVDPFEQAIRAILGQLVSVAMAAKLTSKLTLAFGKPCDAHPGWWLFPGAQTLASLPAEQVKTIGVPLKRAQAIVTLAQASAAGDFPLRCPEDVAAGVKALTRYPGIGNWTANYYALRGWQAPDVFLPDDYLIKQRFAGMTPATVRRYATRWQPWRSYALLHIWYSDGWQPDNGQNNVA